MKHLTDETVTKRVMNAVAAGDSDQESSVVDMAGFDAVRFTALFGTLTANQETSLVIEHSDASDTGFTPIANASTADLADDDDNDMLIVDVSRPMKRYVRAVVKRDTANAVIDGVIAEQYRPRTLPTTQDATVVEAVKVNEEPDAA